MCYFLGKSLMSKPYETNFNMIYTFDQPKLIPNLGPRPSQPTLGLTLNHAITQLKLNRTLSNFKHNLAKTHET